MNTKEITDKFQDLRRRATERTRQASAASDDYVRRNTWSTIALVAVFGCVMGYLLAGRRR